jgi:hypothetical protein
MNVEHRPVGYFIHTTSVLLFRERGPGPVGWIFLGTLLGPEGSGLTPTLMDVTGHSTSEV